MELLPAFWFLKEFLDHLEPFLEGPKASSIGRDRASRRVLKRIRFGGAKGMKWNEHDVFPALRPFGSGED